MQVGSIVFGPSAAVKQEIQRAWGISVNAMPYTQACNCMGPQPGETKCPCMLAAEMTKANAMVRDGIIIGGVRYKLVPES